MTGDCDVNEITAGEGFVPAAASEIREVDIPDNALGAGTGSKILGNGRTRTACVEPSTTSEARNGADLGTGIGVNIVLGAGTGHKTVLETVFDSRSGTLKIHSSSISNR